MYPPTFNPYPSFLFTIFTLQTTLHWSVLHCTVLHRCAMQRSAEQCTVLHCFVFHCTALIFTALHRTDLQCYAAQCSTMLYIGLFLISLHCRDVHCTALHCTGPVNLSEYLLMSWSSSPSVTISGGCGNHWSQGLLLSLCTVLEPKSIPKQSQKY